VTSTAPLVQQVAPAPPGTSPLADAARGESPKPATTTKRKTRKSSGATASSTSLEPKAANSTKKATKKKVHKRAKADAAGADKAAPAKPAHSTKTAKKKAVPNDGSRP
jgi:hypothetical protein